MPRKGDKVLNEVRISGRVGRDLELRATSRPGFNVGNFSIAVPKKSKNDPSGFETMWFDVTVFGEKANELHGRVLRGLKTVVSGRLDQQSWLDKNSGQKRSKVVILASEVEVEQQPIEHERPYVPNPVVYGQLKEQPSYDDDSIPF